MLDRLKRLLASPRFPWIAAALAVVLFLPVLDVGLMMDDYLHRVTYEGGLQLAPRPNWDLFRFVSSDPAEFARNADYGAAPWWTLPGYKLAFFRPRPPFCPPRAASTRVVRNICTKPSNVTARPGVSGWACDASRAAIRFNPAGSILSGDLRSLTVFLNVGTS